MCNQMFRCIGVKKLRSMLPEILKPFSPDQLKAMCLEQLEGMSKKRIIRILDGAEPDTISSSGTEDESEEEEIKEISNDDNEATESEAQTYEDIVQTNDVTVQPDDVQNQTSEENNRSRASSVVHSRDSRSFSRSRSRSLSRSRSRSFSRSRSRSRSHSSNDYLTEERLAQHRAEMQEQSDREETSSLLAVSGSEEGEILEYRREDMEAMQEEVAALQRKEYLEHELAAAPDAAAPAVALGPAEPGTQTPEEQATEEEVPASLSTTQMEILELEMRARAIKAMLEKRKACL